MEKQQVYNTAEKNAETRKVTSSGVDITPVWITNVYGVVSCKPMNLYNNVYKKDAKFRLATIEEVEKEVAIDENDQEQLDSLENKAFSELKKLAKENGINSFGMNKVTLLSKLKSVLF